MTTAPEQTAPVSDDTLDALMTHIGGEISDTPAAWISVAMECLDQAGLSAAQQQRVAEVLRFAQAHSAYPEGDYP